MGRIFIVRHGQCTDNAAGILNGLRDSELTRRGKKQAYLATQKLKDKNIRFIFSSWLKRHTQTAGVIGRVLGIDQIDISNLLVERDMGILTGESYKMIPVLGTEIIYHDGINYFTKAFGAEEFPDVLERARKILREIKTQFNPFNVLIVTSGDMVKMLRADHFGWDWERGLRTPFIDNCGIIELI